MKYFKYIILVFLLVEVFYACNPQPEASKLLVAAEQFADQEQIDSALVFIDSIFYPEKSFKKDEYMQYLITRTRVRYKAYREIKGDTDIFKAWNYYKQKDKPKWTALAAFYSGCVYREQGNKEQAMHAYLEALTSAKETNDNDLKGLVQNNIGDILWQQDLYSKALDAYKEAKKYYTNLPEKKLIAISNIGHSYLMMGKTDTAILVYKKALESVDKGKFKKEYVLLNQNLSIAYSVQSNYPQALFCLKQAYEYNADSTVLPKLYWGFSKLYSQMGLIDSAKHYNDLIKARAPYIKDLNLQISIYSLLSQNEELSKNYLQSIDYLKKEIEVFEKYLFSQNKNSIIDVQQKYNYEHLRNAYQEKLTKFQYALILLLFIILVGIALFARYRIFQKNKLIETHEKIITLTKMASELEHSSSMKMSMQEQNIRELLLWKFDVIKKSVLLTKIDSDDAPTAQLAQKFHQIVYRNKEHEYWPDFEKIMNEMGENVPKRVRLRFPFLSEKEYRICLLTYAGMSVKEIAVILELSANSIQVYRSSIRKKMKIESLSVSTESFLKQELGID